MDWLTFVSKIADAVAWPLALIVASLLIRKPLLRAVPFLRKLKYSDVEVEFSQEISSLRKEITSVEGKDTTRQFSPAKIPDRIIQIVSISPRAAIMESWKDVEAAIIAIAQRDKSIADRIGKESPLELVSHLEKAGKLSRPVADFIRRLDTLLNKYKWAEGIRVDPDLALEIIDICISFAAALSAA